MHQVLRKDTMLPLSVVVPLSEADDSQVVISATREPRWWMYRLSSAIDVKSTAHRRITFNCLAHELLNATGFNERRAKQLIQDSLVGWSGTDRNRAVGLLFESMSQILRSRNVDLFDPIEQLDLPIARCEQIDFPLRVHHFTRLFHWHGARFWASHTLMADKSLVAHNCRDAVMRHLCLAVESVDRQGLLFNVKRLLMTLPLEAHWIQQFTDLVSKFMIPFFKVILRNDPNNKGNKKRRKKKKRREKEVVDLG